MKQLSLAPGERREILVDMSNGDEVSITCGEAASIVDRIRGFFEPSSILVSTLVLTLRPTGLLPLVTDSLPMRLLPTEIMAGSPIRSRDISLVMTRVLMDNCGTSTVLMSPRSKERGNAGRCARTSRKRSILKA